MSSVTPNLALIKPAGGDPASISAFWSGANVSADLIDAQFAQATGHDHHTLGAPVRRVMSGLAAARPAAGLLAGDVYFATDTNLFSAYNGASWQAVSAGAVASQVQSGTLANRAVVFPAPAAGNIYFATDVLLLTVYDGAAWRGSPVTVGTAAGIPAAGNPGRIYIANNAGVERGYIDINLVWREFPLYPTGAGVKGDVLAHDGSIWQRVTPVGANNTVLSADSAQASGMKWGIAPPRVLKTNAAAVIVVNSAVETVLETYTVLANTLAVGSILRLSVGGRVTNNTGIAQSVIFRVNFAGQALAIFTMPAIAASANVRYWQIAVTLGFITIGAFGGTHADGTLYLSSPDAGADSTVVTGAGGDDYRGAVDSPNLSSDTTVNEVWSLSVQLGAANALLSCVARNATFEQLG